MLWKEGAGWLLCTLGMRFLTNIHAVSMRAPYKTSIRTHSSMQIWVTIAAKLNWDIVKLNDKGA